MHAALALHSFSGGSQISHDKFHSFFSRFICSPEAPVGELVRLREHCPPVATLHWQMVFATVFIKFCKGCGSRCRFSWPCHGGFRDKPAGSVFVPCGFWQKRRCCWPRSAIGDAAAVPAGREELRKCGRLKGEKLWGLFGARNKLLAARAGWRAWAGGAASKEGWAKVETGFGCVTGSAHACPPRF